jgi:hypothetical protein
VLVAVLLLYTAGKEGEDDVDDASSSGSHRCLLGGAPDALGALRLARPAGPRGRTPEGGPMPSRLVQEGVLDTMARPGPALGMFVNAYVASAIVARAAIDAMKRWRQDADLRRRWNDREKRRRWLRRSHLDRLA